MPIQHGVPAGSRAIRSRNRDQKTHREARSHDAKRSDSECGVREWHRDCTNPCSVAEPLPRNLVDDLGKPAAHPDDASAGAGIETLQTHLSYLFLSRARVVKLRKAVTLPFVDFSLRAERVADCHREVVLNRRLAPDVYLGVAAAREVGGHFELRDRWEHERPTIARGPLPECVVVMRRLEDGRDALSLLEAGELGPEHLDAVATRLARFHDRVGLGRPAPWEPDQWWEHCFRPVADTLADLGRSLPKSFSGAEFEVLERSTRERFGELRGHLEERRTQGMAVDGHGDVHLQHVWFEQNAPGPVLIDCVEFDANLRRIDAANEVAFLAMDLAYRGRDDLGAGFLRRYATARDDFGLFRVVDAYQSYRAAVRAKVAALASVDPRIPAEQQRTAELSACRHLELAGTAIRVRAPGALVLVCGSVGVGKSTVAEGLAERTHGVVISSDRTRKAIAGVPLDARRHDAPDEGLYTPANTEAVYGALLDRAEAVIESGRIAILDATFGVAKLRERARAWAGHRGVPVFLVQVQCAEDVVTKRVRRRIEQGSDPSDAGPEFVKISRARFEPPSEWPPRDVYETRTDPGSAQDFLAPLVARLESPR